MQTFFSASEAVPPVTVHPVSPRTVGFTLQPTTPVSISAIRFYSPASDPSHTYTATGRIYDDAGQVLGGAVVGLGLGGCRGWVVGPLADPILLQPGTAYTVAVDGVEVYALGEGLLSMEMERGALVVQGTGGRSGEAGEAPGQETNDYYYVDGECGMISVSAVLRWV